MIQVAIIIYNFKLQQEHFSLSMHQIEIYCLMNSSFKIHNLSQDIFKFFYLLFPCEILDKGEKLDQVFNSNIKLKWLL